MAKRSTGKRERFEIFKRDLFTCQYCGARPPDVVLVVDHILALAAGGPNTTDNLITACEACNQGKSDRALTTRIVRPDADLLYLETQQEIAELRRFQAAVLSREEELGRTVSVIQEAWYASCDHRLDWHPASHVVRQMLNRYGPDVVYEALTDVSVKLAEGWIRGNWVAYAWRVCANIADEAPRLVESGEAGAGA